MSIVELATVDIPVETGLRRQKPPRTEILNESFWSDFDHHTLFYEAIYDPLLQRVRIYAPRLWGLEKEIKSAEFKIDEKAIKINKIKIGKHYDLLDFHNIEKANFLSVSICGTQLELPINKTDTEILHANAIYTLSKDNDLLWIKDWADFYVRLHGADTVVIADNASTSYTREDLLESLKSVNGLKNVRVINVPLKFGPNNSQCLRTGDAKFLQKTLLRSSFDRFFTRDSVMLNVDIDELVISSKAQSVFDATRKTKLGHISIEGRWVHSREVDTPARYADHVWIKTNDTPCPNKYTLASWSPLRHLQMQVHSFVHLDRNIFKSRGNFSFLHCKQISTSWKYDRTKCDDTAYILDKNMVEKMRQFFPTKYLKR